jgi:glutathione S-transferase
LAVLEMQLTKTAYVLGERFTVADVNLAAIISWVRPAPELLKANPHVAAWLSKCLERAAYKKVQGFAKTE